jgi:hypothetical protein
VHSSVRVDIPVVILYECPQVNTRTGAHDVTEAVNHPAHYGGADNPYEAIKVIEAWGLGFCLGNAVKYIARAGKKDATVQDLKKARWYIDRAISNLGG